MRPRMRDSPRELTARISQRNVREYFKQLKEAYQKRDQIWGGLREAIEKSGACYAKLSISMHHYTRVYSGV